MLLSCSLSSVHQSRSEAIDCVTKTFLLVSGGVIKTTGTVRVRLIGRSECRTDPSLAETLNAYSLVLSDSYLRFCPLDRTCAHCCHLVLDKIEFLTKDCVYVQYSILQTTYCEFFHMLSKIRNTVSHNATCLPFSFQCDVYFNITAC